MVTHPHNVTHGCLSGGGSGFKLFIGLSWLRNGFRMDSIPDMNKRVRLISLQA